jgi:hypothetical protein
VTLDFSRYLPRWREADFDALEGLLLKALCLRGGDEAAALDLLTDVAERGAIYFARMREAIAFEDAGEYYGETETGRALRLLAECYATHLTRVALAGYLREGDEGAL